MPCPLLETPSGNKTTGPLRLLLLFATTWEILSNPLLSAMEGKPTMRRMAPRGPVLSTFPTDLPLSWTGNTKTGEKRKQR